MSPDCFKTCQCGEVALTLRCFKEDGIRRTCRCEVLRITVIINPAPRAFEMILRYCMLQLLYRLVTIPRVIGGGVATRFENVTWYDDHWILESTCPDPGHYQGRANLANGYIGINVAALGPFFEVDQPVNVDLLQGWPLFDRRQTFATVSGFFNVQERTEGTNFEWLDQYGSESVISGIPHWSNLIIESQGQTLNASTDLDQIANFSSTFDFKSGVLSWRYMWTPPHGSAFHLDFTMFLHKLFINQAAVQLRITSKSSAHVNVYDILEGDCAVRTVFQEKNCDGIRGTIYTAVSPSGYSNVTAYVFSTLTSDKPSSFPSCDAARNGPNSSTISQTLGLDLYTDEIATISKYIGIASSDAFDHPKIVARDASINGSKAGFSCLLQSHAAAWHRIMPTDSVDNFRNPATRKLSTDPNIVEAQILAITNPFYLLQNTVDEEAMVLANSNRDLGIYSIPVCGLSSSCYAGMIFWDVEVWMAPGLVIAFPVAARQISDYRLDKYEQARRNVGTAYTSSRNQTNFSLNSAIFPWTSGRFGNCTATGPCFDYEYHLNGDIALQLKNYYVITGDSQTFRKSYQPIYESIAQVYSDLIIFDRTLDSYTLPNATDPDEYANFVDNPSYTMILIKTHLETANALRERFDQPVNTSWILQASKIFIPVNRPTGTTVARSEIADIILEYSGMNGTIDVKQADVVLVDDLLNYQNNFTLADLDYYADKQSPDGPGMTYSAFSVVASEAAPAGCSAYTYDLMSSQPYLRPPWFQYSEQQDDNNSTNGGTHPAFPFLTGMGGTNRIAVFGYLGLRLQTESFNVNPSLPPQIEYLKYRNMYWQGHAITAFSNQTHTILGRLPVALVNANATFNELPIPVTIAFEPMVYLLHPNSILTIPNRLAAQNKTVPGNIAQCQPAMSSQPYASGQFPLAAVDGSVSTMWQPQYANQSATLRVMLGSGGIQPIGSFMIDWAQEPARYVNVAFSNSSDLTSPGALEVYECTDVIVKEPYNASLSVAILSYSGNTTSITLPKAVYGGQYAFLTISGNQASAFDNSSGATVAEWAILPEKYPPLARRYYEN